MHYRVGVSKHWQSRRCFGGRILLVRAHRHVCALCRRHYLHLCCGDLSNTTTGKRPRHIVLRTLLRYNHFYDCGSNSVCQDWLEVLPSLRHFDINHHHHCLFLVPRGIVILLAWFYHLLIRLQTRLLSLEDVQGLFGDSVEDGVAIEGTTSAPTTALEASKERHASVIPVEKSKMEE